MRIGKTAGTVIVSLQCLTSWDFQQWRYIVSAQDDIYSIPEQSLVAQPAANTSRIFPATQV